MEIIYTQVASALAETLTHPIDVLKTNRQVSGKSFTSIVKDIYKTRGVSGFYPSVYPAILRHMIYTTMRVQIYEKTRDDKATILKRLVNGAFSGGIAQLVASPADLIKVKMQTGQYTNMLKCFQDVYKKNGIRGLYQGWRPNVLRAATVNMGELAFYDQTKTYLLRIGYPDDIKTHLGSGLVSGFFATLCSCPADVLKSRLMSIGQEGSMVKTFTNIVRNEGIATLWYGFMPNWIRLAPWQLTFWVTYEQLKKLQSR